MRNKRPILFLSLLILCATRSVYALEWADLWQRQDQQAAQALSQGDFEQASTLAKEPLRQGAANYQRNDYQQALESFTEAQGADGHYNRGNSLAKLGRYQEAIKAYDQALAKQADMEDAAFNRDLVEKLLDQQQQQKQQSSENNNDSQENSDQQQSSSSDQSDSAENKSAENNPEDSEQSQQDASDSEQSDTQQAEQNQSEEKAQAEQDQTAASQNETEAARESAESLSDEQQQAAEQWLRRIPDDPGGLLRRKFRYQYQRRTQTERSEQPW